MKIGDVWNGWTVDSFIGEGSFGKVYRVVRKEFGHTYESAIKVIRIPQSKAEEEAIRNEGMTDESITAYYRSVISDIVSEFSLMSDLRGNSNIVSYEDHCVKELEDSFGWEIVIRMEMLTPLYEYLRNHTLTVHDVVRMGIDLCKALETCQRFNIIHRDIKPENIFVSKQGNFKLGDFGIARQMEKTSSGMSKKGTYSYMAPEVYKGFQYNATVDIYSLGIVLYRFLNNNRAPFLPPYPAPILYADKENAIYRRMSGETIPAPCNAGERLAAVILKACSFNPKDRYESPREMRRALESIERSEAEARIVYPTGTATEHLEESRGTSEGRMTVPIDGETTELIYDTLNHQGPNVRGPVYQDVNRSARGDNRNMRGNYEEATVPDIGPYRVPEPETGGNRENNRKGIPRVLVIIGAVVAVAVIAAVGFAVFGNHQDSGEKATSPKTEADAEAKTESPDLQVAPAGESIIYDDVDHNLPITSLRMEFDSIKTIGDGIIRTDVVILLSNHTGHDVTGFAFKAYNVDGDKAEIKNRDKDCGSDAPFYAEGYLPDGGNGVMVSEMTISKKDFKKLNPKKDGHRLKPKCIQVSEAYVFRENTEYNPPTGRLLGPYDDKANKVKYYAVEIDNDNETPIHEGARIVAMRRDDENSGSIRKRSAKGSVDREIPAGSQGFVVERTFNNSGLDRWPAEDYEVYVIDNEYSDGSHYYDSYREKYGQ